MSVKRPTASANEIGEMPAVGSTKCIQWLRERRDLSPETLVFVARAAAPEGNAAAVLQLVGQLLTGAGVPPSSGATGLTSAERVMWKIARKLNLQTDTPALEEYWGRCLDAMWRDILAGTDAKPFWEENFAIALHGKCLDVGRPIYRRRLKEVSIDDLDSDVQQVEADAFTNLAVGEILSAIRDLPPELARAAHLHWIDDLPVESATGQSVASVLGVSPSYTHRLLRRAECALAMHPIIRGLRGQA